MTQVIDTLFMIQHDDLSVISHTELGVSGKLNQRA